MHHRNWCNFTSASCQTRCAEALSFIGSADAPGGHAPRDHRRLSCGSDIATRTFDKLIGSFCFP
jgi:hypothetical protein